MFLFFRKVKVDGKTKNNKVRKLKKPKIYNTEKKIYLTSGAGETGQPPVKNAM